MCILPDIGLMGILVELKIMAAGTTFYSLKLETCRSDKMALSIQSEYKTKHRKLDQECIGH